MAIIVSITFLVIEMSGRRLVTVCFVVIVGVGEGLLKKIFTDSTFYDNAYKRKKRYQDAIFNAVVRGSVGSFLITWSCLVHEIEILMLILQY